MTSYTLHVDMFDNNILSTGGHYPLTISLNTGTITATATTEAGLGLPGSPYTALAHIVPGSGGMGGNYKNAPFSFFSDAVSGGCGMGNSAGGAICGQDLWLIVSGVNSAVPLFNPATKLYGGSNVFAAVDIYDNPNGPTFTVGLGSIPTITTFTNPVPLPAGIRLFGTALAGLGALKLKRRRRQALSAA